MAAISNREISNDSSYVSVNSVGESRGEGAVVAFFQSQVRRA